MLEFTLKREKNGIGENWSTNTVVYTMNALGIYLR